MNQGKQIGQIYNSWLKRVVKIYENLDDPYKVIIHRIPDDGGPVEISSENGTNYWEAVQIYPQVKEL